MNQSGRGLTNNERTSLPSTSFGSKHRIPFKIHCTIFCVLINSCMLLIQTPLPSFFLIYFFSHPILSLFLILLYLITFCLFLHTFPHSLPIFTLLSAPISPYPFYNNLTSHPSLITLLPLQFSLNLIPYLSTLLFYIFHIIYIYIYIHAT